MVKAESDTNCGHRLKPSAGNIQDLAFDRGSFTDHISQRETGATTACISHDAPVTLLH